MGDKDTPPEELPRRSISLWALVIVACALGALAILGGVAVENIALELLGAAAVIMALWALSRNAGRLAVWACVLGGLCFLSSAGLLATQRDEELKDAVDAIIAAEPDEFRAVCDAIPGMSDAELDTLKTAFVNRFSGADPPPAEGV